MGMKIFSFFFKSKSKEVFCVRCGNNIPPYKNCCILGHENRTSSDISSEGIEVICALCTGHLGFEPNAISGIGGVVPAIFWTREEVVKMRGLGEKIHLRNMAKRERRKNTRRNKIKRKRRA